MTLAVLALALCAAPISAMTQAPAKADKIDGAWARTITGPDGSPMAGTAAFESQEGPMRIGFAGDMKDDGSFAGMASGPFGEIAWSAVRAKI